MIWAPKLKHLLIYFISCLALFCIDVVTILRGHSGLVKGLAWDPVGKYIASQADDKSLRVWRTADWHCERVIREPFGDVSLM